MKYSVGVRDGFTLVCLMICVWRVNRVSDPDLRGQPCRSWSKNVWCLSSLISYCGRQEEPAILISRMILRYKIYLINEKRYCTCHTNASSFISNNAAWRLRIYVLFCSVFRTWMPLDSESVSKSCLEPDMIPCQWVMQCLKVSKCWKFVLNLLVISNKHRKRHYLRRSCAHVHV